MTTDLATVPQLRNSPELTEGDREAAEAVASSLRDVKAANTSDSYASTYGHDSALLPMSAPPFRAMKAAEVPIPVGAQMIRRLRGGEFLGQTWNDDPHLAPGLTSRAKYFLRYRPSVPSSGRHPCSRWRRRTRRRTEGCGPRRGRERRGRPHQRRESFRGFRWA